MHLSNTLSRYFGKFANYKFPAFIQRRINALYVKIFGISLQEFDPIESYATLNALFTRSLRTQRPFDPSSKTLISPCDAKITELGAVIDAQALQIKGMSYSVGELLGQSSLKSGYFYINLYLSPKDYHRYHAPCDLEVMEVRYFAGELLPVNEPSLRKNAHLFVRNERVVIVAKTPNDSILYFVAVGALNVGQMVLHFEPRISTNTAHAQSTTYHYPTPIHIAKAQEIGFFKMGSTIVVFVEHCLPSCLVSSKVKFGDTIGELITDTTQTL
ncbi:phosphatidylserine decarboxylase [Helicobacter sp. 12S02634-8]|uniref:phosphatidylserine decarboxylase n=1 Tax=Helicobacter sp. 12S02634-8 TaxID=1476199 RepID=UPI000BA7564D|nr:phosphatidylserine decarboxylase [Helicobacter sp. 12S02634-8]PAF47264.1 phosphatidylserine decarboxylase [Helicobacter sp. 12S02634-8]